jgi:hypothetical protein
MTTELMIPSTGTVAPLRALEVRQQVNLIQEVMRDVMQSGTHYGTVPGCGDKPTLLQPGAHKLMMTFRLVADPEMTVLPMEHGHREVRCKVKLYNQGGVFLGSGVGTCTTLEGKYRFRTGPVEFTDKPVPREYWDLRSTNPAKAKAMIGEGIIPKKNEAGAWVCARQGEKVEHDNPADYYNTVEKMAYKRALVSATLTVTAASDIFTQDIEDMPEVLGARGTTGSPASISPIQATVEPSPAKDKGTEVLNKLKPASASSPTPAAAQSSPGPSAASPVTGGGDSGIEADLLSNILDCVEFLKQSAQGQARLKGIREAFTLGGDAYPMYPDDQQKYLAMLTDSVKAMQGKK